MNQLDLQHEIFALKLEIANIDAEVKECTKHIRDMMNRRKELEDQLIDAQVDLFMERRKNDE